MIFARSENVKRLVYSVSGRWRRYSLRTYAVDQINRPILTRVRIGYVAMELRRIFGDGVIKRRIWFRARLRVRNQIRRLITPSPKIRRSSPFELK